MHKLLQLVLTALLWLETRPDLAFLSVGSERVVIYLRSHGWLVDKGSKSLFYAVLYLDPNNKSGKATF